MKILIFSDSHRHSIDLRKAIAAHSGTADAVLHLGDGVADCLPCLEPFPQMMFAAVAGNYEEAITGYLSAPGIPASRVLELEGVRLFMTHGHRYAVKSGIGAAVAEARRQRADILLFGHTHERMNRYLPAEDGLPPLYVFNPGSIGRPIGSIPSYGVLEIRDGQILLGHNQA